MSQWSGPLSLVGLMTFRMGCGQGLPQVLPEPRPAEKPKGCPGGPPGAEGKAWEQAGAESPQPYWEVRAGLGWSWLPSLRAGDRASKAEDAAVWTGPSKTTLGPCDQETEAEATWRGEARVNSGGGEGKACWNQ